MDWNLSGESYVRLRFILIQGVRYERRIVTNWRRSLVAWHLPKHPRPLDIQRIFPKPHKLGRKLNVWSANDIEAWLSKVSSAESNLGGAA